MPENQERRQIPRIDTTIRVELLDGSGWLVAHDLGLGGMQVTTSTPRWPGTMMRVRFLLPGEEKAVRATCRVVDLTEAPRGVGLALQFLSLASEARQALRRYLGRRSLQVVPDYV